MDSLLLVKLLLDESNMICVSLIKDMMETKLKIYAFVKVSYVLYVGVLGISLDVFVECWCGRVEVCW